MLAIYLPVIALVFYLLVLVFLNNLGWALFSYFRDDCDFHGSTGQPECISSPTSIVKVLGTVGLEFVDLFQWRHFEIVLSADYLIRDQGVRLFSCVFFMVHAACLLQVTIHCSK